MSMFLTSSARTSHASVLTLVSRLHRLCVESHSFSGARQLLSSLTGCTRNTHSWCGVRKPDDDDKSVLEAHAKDRAKKLSEQREEDYRRDPLNAKLLKDWHRSEGKQSVPDMLRAQPRPWNFVGGGSSSSSRKYLEPKYLGFKLGPLDIDKEQPRAFIEARFRDAMVDVQTVFTDTLDVQNEAEVQAAVIEELVKPSILAVGKLGFELGYCLQRTTNGTRPDITITWNGRPVFQIEVKGLAVLNKVKGGVYADALDPNGKIGLRCISQLNYSMAMTGVLDGCVTNVQRTVFVKREVAAVSASRDIMRDAVDLTPLETLTYCLTKGCEAYLRSLQQLPSAEPRGAGKSGAAGHASGSDPAL